MKNFDISKLDEYYDSMISFKCVDILKWVQANMENPDFDIQFAAQDIYGHYFSNKNKKRKPKNDYFYFIKNNAYGKTLYKLERDYVLSPTKLKKNITSTLIEQLNKETINIRNKITCSEEAGVWEMTLIDGIEQMYKSRLTSVIGKPYIEADKFHKYKDNQKGQIYSITTERLKDYQTLIFVFKKIAH